MATIARRRPTLLAIDEAHQLGTGAGEVLLDKVPDLRGDGLPVVLILAGTPELPCHHATMGGVLLGSQCATAHRTS